MNTTNTTNTRTAPTRLETIAHRHSKNRVRDALFAVCVALATVVSISTVSTASHAASTSQVVQR